MPAHPIAVDAVMHNASTTRSADTITIDRNARKALLAAISMRMNHYEQLEDTIREGDRVLLGQAREDFEYVWPILDALNWWEANESSLTYEIPTSKWLEELVEWFRDETRGAVEGEEANLAEVLEEGEAAFKPGGSYYSRANPTTEHTFSQMRDFIVRQRALLEDWYDEIVGMESIIAALSVPASREEEGEDR